MYEGELSWRDEAGHLVLTDTDTSTHKMGDKSWRTVSVIRLRLGWEDRDRQIYCHVTSHVAVEPLQVLQFEQCQEKEPFLINRIGLSYLAGSCNGEGEI